MTRNFFFAVLVISIGSGFQHGYHIGSLNVPSQTIQKWISTNRPNETLEEDQITVLWSTTVAIFAIGGIFGGFLIGIFADNFGRKGGLKVNNFIILAAVTIMAFSKKSRSLTMLITGRFLAGVNAGINSGLCPMYLIEIAPDNIRGAIGSFYHFTVLCGTLLSQTAGCAMGNDDNWPYIFVVAVGPAILQLVLLPICPESPKYILITQDKDRKAENVLQWLTRKQNVRLEMELLKKEDNLVKQLRHSSLKRIIRNPTMNNALLCSLAFHLSQQACGMNVQLFYSTPWYNKVLGFQLGGFITLGTTILQLIGNALSIFYIDRCGRKKIMQISFGGVILATMLLFINECLFHMHEVQQVMIYPRFVFHCFLDVFYCIGLGPMPWFITAELLTYTSRTIAVCLTVVIHWLTNFVVSQSYLILREEIGPFTRLIYIILDIFFFLFLNQRLPETAKLSVIDIIKMYVDNSE